jgi:hypothetical protein
MLIEAQTRLEDQFAKLSRERAANKYPVYALEHGLEASDIDAIRQELGREQTLRREHWLLWIVIAAEVGYSYDGDEYWISFAAEMPGWSQFGDRETIREWFRRFASDFSGFTPRGRWAEHFSIIAWPITHSILPRYLQSHFAQHLHDLRYELASSYDIGIEKLGELLKAGYHGYSSRFGNFLEQTELTSRLVLALRDEDVQDTVAPVTKATLTRIVSDLERQRAARDYLSVARRVLREARLQATTRLVASTTVVVTEARTAEPEGGGLKLIARRSSGGSWNLGVTFPDLMALLRRSGATVGTLGVTRIRLSDKADSWMPAQALLSYSGKEYALRALPIPLTRGVVEFEQQIRGFSDLVAPKLRIQGSAPWLLRIQGDGAARQVLGNHVRSGQIYLVITQGKISDDVAVRLELREQECQTNDVGAYLIDIPRRIGDEYLRALAQLKLGYALQAHVEPVGLVPRWNETVGGSVWLSTEELILRLWADFDVGEFAIRLDGRDRTLIPVHNSNDAIVSLGTLPIGRHVIEVGTTIARDQGAKIARSLQPEQIVVEVRAPVPWREGIRHQAGVRAVLEPPESSFEDLMNGRAEIALHGPADRNAMAELRLFDANGHQVDGSEELGQLPLPSSATAVHRIIEKLRTEPLSEKIQAAHRVDLVFRGDELGSSSLTFPKDVEPLRWKLEHKQARYAIRLIDEAGPEQEIRVERYDMRVPDRRERLELDLSLAGVPVEPPGSLFVARHEKRLFSTIPSIAPQQRLTAFTDLGIDIKFASSPDHPRRIGLLLALQRRWGRAQALGPLGMVRKANVLAAFEQQIARMACGPSWADRARDCRGGQKMLLDRLQREVGGSPGFASRMRSTQWSKTGLSRVEREEFLKIAKTYSVSGNPELCELAMRLAFQPNTIPLADLDKILPAFEELARNPILARGAFFAKLSTDMAARERAASSGGEAA